MPDYLISTGIPALPAGLTDRDAGLVAPLYRAINNLAQQVATLTGNVQYSGTELAIVDQLTSMLLSKEAKIYVQASADLAFGEALTLSVSGGRIVATQADATNLAKPCHAFCNTLGGILTGASGEATTAGRTPGITGTTFGATYYLSTAGTIQITGPTADSVLNQVVGVGLGSAGFLIQIEPVGKRVSRVYKTTLINLRVQYTDGSFEDNAV
jgi:hypothetical protein